MRRLFSSGIEFVKNNQTIISSLLLIFVVVGALFLNSYVTLSRFQENLDKILRGKAVMAQNIIEISAKEYFVNPARSGNELQAIFEKIKNEDSEISEIVLFAKNENDNEYAPVVQSKKDDLNKGENEQAKLISENAKKFALSVDDAFAYLTNDNEIRHWNVVKAIRDSQGVVAGILLMKLSLAENDALVQKTITRVYLLSIGGVVLVLLLILNHLRLFSYEIKAKKLEEIDKMKDDFISMASHELKSPLTAIRGYAELLKDTFAEKNKEEIENEQKRYIENIDISTQRLGTLVEDLLDVSRIEQNRLPFDCKTIEMDKIVSDIEQEMKVMADQKELQLLNNIKGISKVEADPERVKQILINLVSNAIKYTPKGKVEIQGKEDEKWVYITVTDTGMGISAENLAQLFSKFYRIKNSETANISGTGLGLWISREIAQKMGGDLTVESIEGVGSHFTLKIKKI